MKGTFYIGIKCQCDDEKNILDDYLNVKWEGDKDTLCISTFGYFFVIVSCYFVGEPKKYLYCTN